MGIHRLEQFIRGVEKIKFFRDFFSLNKMKETLKMHPELKDLSHISVFDIKWSFCVVDALQRIYKGLYACSMYKKSVVNDGRDITHLFVVLQSVAFFLKNKVIPIFVFDGKSPDIKQKTLHKRKILSENKFNIFDRMIKGKFIKECKYLLKLLGIPCIQAPGEADIVCAEIMKKNPEVYGIVSDDTDCLVFGGGRLLTGFSRAHCCVTEYELPLIYKLIENKAKEICKKHNIPDIKIGHKEFILTCIFLGTDYCYGMSLKGFEYVFEELVLNNFNITTTKFIPRRLKENWEIIFNYYTSEIKDLVIPKILINVPHFIEIEKLLGNGDIIAKLIKSIRIHYSLIPDVFKSK